LRGAPRLPRALEPLVADIGVDAARYDAIRPAAKQTLGSAGAGRVIACVYEPSARQRIATVLRTFALLAPRHPDLRLALVGRGSDQEDLRMHAAALGVTNVVSHLGERDDELAVLKTADVGWVVADGDEAAFAALDLMALRIPVLADRDTVAARYVADGITGTLLPPGDAPATAALLSVVLAHAEQRSAMGSAGRTRVARDFSEREMADQFAAAADLARDRTRWVR
jgi:glycosyltransferase involved in cell wall biosynthesis